MPDFVFELPEPRPAPPESVEVSDGAIDHAEAAVNRLAIQFRKPKIIAFVRALCKQMQPLEEAFVDLRTLRSIDLAFGAQLVLLGKLVGQPEVDLDEVDFKSLVRARVRANASSGLGNQILLVARLVFTDYAARVDVAAAGTMRLQIVNLGNAGFSLRVVDMDLPWELATLFVERFLREIAGDGIRGVLEFVVQHDAVLDDYSENAFELGDSLAPSTSAEHGLGDALDTATGGRLSAAME